MNDMGQMTETNNYNPLIITDDTTNARYYGGNQDWYSSNTMAYAGCGSVAAANMLRVLAGRYPDAFTGTDSEIGTLTDEKYYKSSLLKLMADIYNTMLVFETPLIRRIYDFGKQKNRGRKLYKYLIPSFGMSICGFIQGTLRFCESKGLLLHSHSLPTAFISRKRGIDFIKRGLETSGSVVILTSLNRHPLKLYNGECGRLEKGYDTKYGMKSHFALITGIESQDDVDTLVISTWGRVASVEYSQLYKSWQSPLAFTSCLFYFTPVKSKRVVKTDKMLAIAALIKAVFRGLFGWIDIHRNEF